MAHVFPRAHTSSPISTPPALTLTLSPRAHALRPLAPPLQLLILWVTLFGTSLFLLLMVLHAYHLTSPLGSPRTFAVGGPGWSGGGYSAVGSAAVPVFATPLQPPPSIDAAARAQRERELQMAEAEALDALVS